MVSLTYFQFKKNDVTPAVFAVDESGNESLVNFTIQGQYLVVERIGRQFTLRDGKAATCIFNDSYKEESGTQAKDAPIKLLEEKKTASADSAQSSPKKPASSFLAFLDGDGTGKRHDIND